MKLDKEYKMKEWADSQFKIFLNASNGVSDGDSNNNEEIPTNDPSVTDRKVVSLP